MRMPLLIPLLGALALLPSATSAANNQILQAVVGPDAQITLEAPPGPGTYTIHVTDLSPEHNFHLTGPGIDQATSVEEVGEVDWNVTFVAARYRYQCDPHPVEMSRDFFVVTPAPPPPPQPPPPSVRRCIVPKVTGKSLAAATRAIARGHCLRVGKVRRKRSAKVPRGRVISQRPRAGTKLAKGGRIDLVVSRGQKAR